jgi:hypothetical protein
LNISFKEKKRKMYLDRYFDSTCKSTFSLNAQQMDKITQDLILMNAEDQFKTLNLPNRPSTGFNERIENYSLMNRSSFTPPIVKPSTCQANMTNAKESDYFSEIENKIYKSTNPIDTNETEEITINGYKGLWLNKSEILNWSGHLPISQYPINDDQNPKIVRKLSDKKCTYEQDIAIRYLRPPTPPPPGDILIKEELQVPDQPAPPLIIRQQPPRPITPPPLVIREAPPLPPTPVPRKVITIERKVPPPPRKVIIERLPSLPPKPQSIIIERWLPYKPLKRKVIYVKSAEKDSTSSPNRGKNIIIHWNSPQVFVKKEFKDLGIVKANPIEYMQRYGCSLKRAEELPMFVKNLKPPNDYMQCSSTSICDLEDAYASNYIDFHKKELAYECQYLLRQMKERTNMDLTMWNQACNRRQLASMSVRAC